MLTLHGKNPKLSPAHPPSIPMTLKAKMPSEKKCSDYHSNTLQCFYVSADIILDVQKPREVNLTSLRSRHMATNRSRPPGSQACV